MMRRATLTFILFANCALAQNTSSIKIDTGSGNDIGVVQSGAAKAQNSDIGLGKGDKNKIRVSQTDTTSHTNEKPSESTFDTFINSTTGVVTLLTAITTLLGLWGLSRLRKRHKKER